jgi:hypothetical protein
MRRDRARIVPSLRMSAEGRKRTKVEYEAIATI